MDKNLTTSSSLEIEKNVLAILLSSPLACEKKIALIRQEDFLFPAHQTIFQALATLYQKSKTTFNIALLANYLEKKNQLAKIGGNQYLQELLLLFVSEELLEEYLDILLKNAALAKLENSLKKWQQNLTSEKDPKKTINLIYTKLDELENFQHRDRKNFQFLSHLIDDVVQKWKDFKFQPNAIECTTGFQILDSKTNGFQKGDLIIVAARPSMGKTALLLNIALNNVFSAQEERSKGDVVLFSLEMSKNQLVQRILRANVPNLNLNKIDYQDFQDIKSFSQKMAGSNLLIDTSMTLDIHQIHLKLRNWIKKRKIKLVILDYLQLLKPLSQRFENRNLEVSFWTRQLKEMAREFDIPVICASQLSRYVEKREEKRPLLSDLRDSGSIEQDADLVLFLYREHYYQKKVLNLTSKKNEKPYSLEPHDAEVIIAKHRNGPTGTVKLLFVPQKTSFYEISSDE